MHANNHMIDIIFIFCKKKTSEHRFPVSSHIRQRWERMYIYDNICLYIINIKYGVQWYDRNDFLLGGEDFKGANVLKQFFFLIGYFFWIHLIKKANRKKKGNQHSCGGMFKPPTPSPCPRVYGPDRFWYLICYWIWNF